MVKVEFFASFLPPFATDFEGLTWVCRNISRLSQQLEVKNTAKNAGGIVGKAEGSNTLTNCRSSVDIQFNKNGDVSSAQRHWLSG